MQRYKEYLTYASFWTIIFKRLELFNGSVKVMLKWQKRFVLSIKLYNFALVKLNVSLNSFHVMSKMIVNEQVIKDAVDNVVNSVYELENVLDVLTEKETSLNAEYEALKNISIYMRLLKTEMLSAYQENTIV